MDQSTPSSFFPRPRRPLVAALAAAAAATSTSLSGALPGADAALLRAPGSGGGKPSASLPDGVDASPGLRALKKCKKGKCKDDDDADKDAENKLLGDGGPPVLIEDKFYPIEIDGVRQCVSPAPEDTDEMLLYDTLLDCCTFYGVCPDDAGGTADAPDASTTTTTTPAPPKPEYWYPGVNETIDMKRCFFGSDYDPDWLELKPKFQRDLFFGSLADCCEEHEEACVYWYPTELDDGTRLCVLGDDYPESFLEGSASMLYDDHDECCATYGICPGDAGAGGASGNPVKWWPFTDENGDVECVENGDYEPSWIGYDNVLFDDLATCCEYYEVCPEPAAPPYRPPHWYPVADDAGGHSHCAFDDLYPEAYEHESALVFFKSEYSCCQEYDLCPERWYPKTQEDETTRCELGTDYPEVLFLPENRDAWLFVDKMYCCMNYPFACPTMLWHPNEGYTDCTYSEDYPQEYIDENKLFVDRDLCLAALPGMDQGNSDPHPNSGPPQHPNAGPPPSDEPQLCDAPECVWHESRYTANTCTNSGDYPPVWDSPEAYNYTRANFFFTSPEECCATRFPGECTIEHVGGDVGPADDDDGHGEVDNAGYVTVAPGKSLVEDFEGEAVLHFDLGPHWEYSENPKSGSTSLVNKPRSGKGKESDLVLRVRLSSPAQVRCQVLLDVMMPYEMFYLEVDEEQRNTYPQKEADFINLETGVGAGDHEFVFRVKNNENNRALPPGDRDEEVFGTARVWVDNCEVEAAPY